MNKDLNDLLMIDQEIGDFLYENNQIDDLEFNNLFEEKKFVDRALKMLRKLSSKNIIEVVRRSRYLNSFIDLKKYIKKYPINKKYLKNNQNEYINEYHKLRNICMHLSDIVESFDEYYDYMDLLDVDNVEVYLLTEMPNDQIYTLASETEDWSLKLYYFSYFKKKKK